MSEQWTVPMLRITGCQDHLLWYADQVGKLVPYEADDGQYGYRSREPDGHLNFVRREDARVTRVRVDSLLRQRWPFNSRHARRVVDVRRVDEACGALCDELAVCQGLRGCRVHATQPAGQSRRHSLVEAVANIAVGFVVSLGITAVVMPAFGNQVTLSENFAITAIFTVASLVRAYALRRLFNRWAA